MTALSVAIKRLDHAADLALPAYATADSAGMDLLAAVEASISLAPGERRLIPTGIAIALPPGTEAQVRPRSGLALKHGITVLNAPGTIDADYRSEERRVGKEVSVRVALGGRRIIKKKKNQKQN